MYFRKMGSLASTVPTFGKAVNFRCPGGAFDAQPTKIFIKIRLKARPVSRPKWSESPSRGETGCLPRETRKRVHRRQSHLKSKKNLQVSRVTHFCAFANIMIDPGGVSSALRENEQQQEALNMLNTLPVGIWCCVCIDFLRSPQTRRK